MSPAPPTANESEPTANQSEPSADECPPPTNQFGPTAADLFGAFDVMKDFVKYCEPGCYTGEAAAEMVKCFSTAKRCLSAGESLFVRRVQETRLHEQEGDKQMSTWLSRLTGEPEGQSASKLEAARKIEAHPQVQEAFRAGDLSEAQAREVASVADHDPEQAKVLIDQASSLTYPEFKKRCSEARSGSTSADDEIARHDRIRKDRYCKTWVDAEGAGHLDARMTPDALGIIKANLGLFESQVFSEARREGRRESRRAYMVDALVAMAQASGALGSTGTSGDARGSSGDSEKNPSHNSAGGAKRTKRSRQTFDPKALVRIRIDSEAFFRGYAEQGETCEIPGVGAVPVAAVRDLLGVALLELVITKGTDVTTVVSDSRFVRKALRIALEERDPTCVVPGCDKSDPLERDHWQVDFGKQGPTCIDNLCRLCSWHHSQKTNHGWKLEGGPGQWRFYKPDAAANRTVEGDLDEEVTDTAEAKEAKRRATRANDPPGNDPPTQEPML